MSDPPVGPASWRLTAIDIANGNGTALVTLRSGIRFVGSVDINLSRNEVLFLRTDSGGWCVIDWTEIVAMGGEPP